MKRLIPAFIVLFIAIILCFVSNISSNMIIKELKEDLIICKQLNSQTKFNNIKDNINQFKNKWEYKEKYLAIFVNHKLIDGISININNLYNLSSFDNDLYLLILSEIDYYLDMTIKEQSITAESFY